MRTRAKVGVVVTGYVAAVGAAILAGWMYNVRVSALPYDTSGGMYAGGEALTSLGAFLVIALFPTLLALWFVRRHERFWNVVGTLAIIFAAVGLVSVLKPVGTNGARESIPVFLLSILWLGHMLGAPLWAMAFGLFALLAPTPRARRRMMVALGIELFIGICAFVHWFVPGSPL